MDYINKLKEIVPKMKMQMHSNKDIFSLNEIPFSLFLSEHLCEKLLT